ncbi:hypothetical protein [Nonomuraea sp. NEAU-A123]|uniref:nSTAND1 domain-containing NTPase n=1 Tax=Nonomuraea sp. NEAU-A123 TaxID=2839649 RepID=UPI0035AC230F
MTGCSWSSAHTTSPAAGSSSATGPSGGPACCCASAAGGPWRRAAGSASRPAAVVSGVGRVCPYQGLAPFESDRSELFFGRRRAIHNLLRRLGPRLTEHECVCP